MFPYGKGDQTLKVDSNDTEAMDRIQRAIITVVKAGIGRLEALGYERGKRPGKGIEIAQDTDGLPLFLKLDGEVVFTVREHIDGRHGLSITGEWQRDVPARKLRWWERLFRRRPAPPALV